MAQWSKDRSPDRSGYPDERRTLLCPPAARALLLRFDHHVVWIDGREALLLTYLWNVKSPGADSEPWPFEVSFTYAKGHPRGPAAVQDIIDKILGTSPPAPVDDADAASR
jgi:hypothetical protein